MDKTWLAWALLAVLLLGIMNGIRGIFSKVDSGVFLFIIGACFLVYFSLFIARDMPPASKGLLVVGYAIVFAVSIAVAPKIGFWTMFWLVFSGIASSVGNHALFNSIQAIGNGGYPLAVLSLFSIVALLISIAFGAGGVIGIQFVGWNVIKENFSQINFFQWVGMASGLVCAVSFALANK